MSREGLHLRMIEPHGAVIHIDVTSPAHRVAILDAAIGVAQTPTPLHWRTGDWKKPPLDLSLSLDGRPEGLQIVLQDEEVRPADRERPLCEVVGVPLFEVAGWPIGRYLDVHTEVQVVRLSTGELAVTIGGDVPIQMVQLGAGLEFGLDQSGGVTQMVVGPLSVAHWALIEAAAG